MAREIGGEIDTVSAIARTLAPVRREYDEAGRVTAESAADADDTFFAHLQFAGGALGVLGFSAAGHGEPIALPGGRVIYGTRGCLKEGALILDDGMRRDAVEVYREQADAATQAREFPLPLDDPFALEALQFFGAIETGVAPELSGDEGLRDLAAAFAILESSHAGCPVRVADVESGAISAYQDALNHRWGIE